MALPEGPHCLKCKHHRSCMLPQREAGTPCGWYNAAVQKVVRRGTLKPGVRVTSG